MKNALNSLRIEIPCPHCSHQVGESIGKLKSNPDLTCGGCGRTFGVDASKLAAEIAKVEQALTEFSRSPGKLGQ